LTKTFVTSENPPLQEEAMATKGDDLEAVRSVVEALKDFDGPDQERILRWVREKLGLPAASTMNASLPAGPPAGGGVVLPPGAGSSLNEDMRSFISSKNPQSDTHFAAAVAYYYRFMAPADKRKETITAGELQNACRMADRDRLTNPGQTLINAHHTGLLDNVGRGAYAINAVGENLIAMALPEGGGKAKVKKAKVKKSKKKAKKKRRIGRDG
jgi:hypothetical protein